MASSSNIPGVTVIDNNNILDENALDKLEIMPLGAGNEVGRSAILIRFKGKTVLMDCGIHPAYNGLASLPFFDEVDPSTIDLLLVSHFHLDHCGAVPFFLQKTSFKGRTFMTHPTKAIYKMLLSDLIKVSTASPDEILYDERDLNATMEKIELIDYHQELEHNGIKFWCYNAGHVLGAAMFMIEIAGVKVLYTGDFSRHPDRHLLGAETPPIQPDVLIVESTYGIQVHEPRIDRENRFTGIVSETVRRGGRMLIPVFALGRAQELLLILDEYWEAHPELQHIPIYYASSLAKKCMAVFQTYINTMNERIRKQNEISNPFVFKHISNLKSMEQFEDTGPCVVMASPGMLQSGMSMQLFEMWCSDKRNSILLPGYCVEGTLAKTIMSEPKTVTLSNGMTVPMNMNVFYISFSAHSDFEQTSDFLNYTHPPNVVLVHGDPNNMAKLKQALLKTYEKEGMQVHTPKNTEVVTLYFRGEKSAKVVGSLAAQPPQQGQRVSGLLVQKNFQRHLLAPHDLDKYAQLSSGSVKQRIAIAIEDRLGGLFLQQLKDMFGENQVAREASKDGSGGEGIIKIAGCVTIEQNPVAVAATDSDNKKTNEVLLSWTSSALSNMIADAVLNCLLELEMTPTEKERTRPIEIPIMRSIQRMLGDLYGEVKLDMDKQTFHLEVDGTEAVIEFGGKITCDDPVLERKLNSSLKRMYLALMPFKIDDEMFTY